MARVLLIGNASDTIRRLGRLLTAAGHEAVSAAAGPPAAWSANGHTTHLAIIDLDSLKRPGLDALRALRATEPPTVCVVVSSPAGLRATIQAFREGASDCLESPVRKADLLDTVDRLTRCSAGVPHDLIRLADRVVVFLKSENDARTQSLFGRAVGISYGCFRNWRVSAQMDGKALVKFARGLRAVYAQLKGPHRRPKSLLAIVDPRFRRAFLIEAGGTKDSLPPSLAAYLERQQFIRDPEFIAVVRERLLAERIPIDACAERSVSVTPAIDAAVECAADRWTTLDSLAQRTERERAKLCRSRGMMPSARQFCCKPWRQISLTGQWYNN